MTFTTISSCFSKIKSPWQVSNHLYLRGLGIPFCSMCLYLPRKNSFSFFYLSTTQLLLEKRSLSTLSKLSNTADKDIKCCLVFLVHSHSVIRHPLNADHVLVTVIIIAYKDLVLLLESFSAVSYSQMRGYFPCMEPLGGGYFSWVEAGVVEMMPFLCFLTPLIFPQVP